MPPRRGRGRKAATPSKADQPPPAENVQDDAEAAESETPENNGEEMADAPGKAKGGESATAVVQKKEPAAQENGKKDDDAPTDDVKYPYQIKVTRLPPSSNLANMQQYLATTFKILVPKVTVHDNNTLVKVYLTEREPMERLARLLNGHVWRKKTLRAEPWLPLENKKRKREEGDETGEDDQEKKKNKVEEAEVPLTLSEEFLSESMPLMRVPYEEQKRISHQDAELMSARLHALMCERNPALAGWAEKSCDDFGGTIYPIDDVRSYANLRGYRNKCKFRIGKNNAGETIVGFVLNDNENKILGVEPGDNLIHLPDIMKLAAKRLQEFVRASDKGCYDRKKKTGLWESLRVRMTPDHRLMLVVVVNPRGLDDATLEKAKNDVKEFFMNGDGKDCNVMSLYLHVTSPNPNVSHANDKLHHLDGATDIEETICGIKFHVSPLSILNIYPYALQTIYESVEEVAQPTPDSVVIDACAGSCGVAFTLARTCEKAYAIELQQLNIDDAEKSKALNNIENVEIIQGKCEEKIEAILEANKEKPMIIVLDPPRHGVESKIISYIRAQPNVKRIIFMCCDTNTEIKNLVELGAAEGKDSKTGLEFAGLPFLPLRVIPIDVAPYTIINTLLFVLERVDPTTYPPATRPIPQLSKQDTRKKFPQDKRVRDRRLTRGGRSAPPLMRTPIRGPPRRNAGGGGGGRYVEASVISKYERRIAELEEQQRAYKAGLAMGMQAFNRGGGGGSGGNFGGNSNWNYNSGGGSGYGGGYSNDTWGNNNPAWQSSTPFGNTGNWGGNSGGWGGGYNDNQGFGGPDRSRQNNSQRNNPMGGRNSGGWSGGRGGGNRNRR